ncbi:MAG: sodium:proton exchanger [Candidatus Limnocylindrales bacterium]
MWRRLGFTAMFALPAIVARLTGAELPPGITVLLYGAGVVASAVLLSWAAEAAQVDISGSLAIAILALIAVLPEYAVDLYFSFTAGGDPTYTQFAAANMTGSNRLLIGIGWPVVAFVGFWAMRRARGRGAAEIDPAMGARDRAPAVVLPPRNRVELAFLAVASAYAFLIPLTRSIAWYDAVVLLALFGAYLFRVTREGRGEPELIGVAADIALLPQRRRRALVTGLFVAAAAIVVMAAKPFADGLVATGETLGIDQFLLVQWLAPLSSEAPELIVATIFAWRLHAAEGLGMLLSAKVNQWTLLVGSLWVAYTLGGGAGAPLPLDGRQTEEFLLTSAQALLAFAVLADRRFGLWEAGAVLGLFALQFPFPTTEVRLAFSAAYLVVAVALLVRKRRHLTGIFMSIGRWEGTFGRGGRSSGDRASHCPLSSCPIRSAGRSQAVDDNQVESANQQD